MKNIFIGSLLLGVIVFFASCSKDTIYPETSGTSNTVYYTTQIFPLFSVCSGCHSGGLAPNFSGTASEVYTSLSSGDYIPGKTAETSLYKKLSPSGSMYGKMDASSSAIVLGWIDQGALNN